MSRTFSLRLLFPLAACLWLSPAWSARAEEGVALLLNMSRGEAMLADYFQAETARLEANCLAEMTTLEDWTTRREEYRRQLLEMLGLDPLPERTDLKAEVTDVAEHEMMRVEKLHFQSSPGLYVTANLYLPIKPVGRLPAVLYVCGHGPVKKDGVSFGNKVTYHHHGAWFARHGFACLTIDSLQLGEIEGIHHGTHNLDRWWWVSRGYTPAGVEAWNCVRAIDYLQSRPDIDGARIGVTGRSGGGAYSWWIAAIDERIQAAVPVAGITDLRNHVVDGCVEGHCDCMYFLNTYRWDYPLVAALVAPRPLLISNTDDDGIFPLDGVVRTYDKVRKIYELYGARDKLGLSIAPGPHKDTQELQVPAFRWLARHLKQDETPVAAPAEKFFTPEQLKVFATLPVDEKNTSIDESFVAKASEPPIPDNADVWREQTASWRKAILEKTFRAWPRDLQTPVLGSSQSSEANGLRFDQFRFASQPGIELDLYVVRSAGGDVPETIVLNVLDETLWDAFSAAWDGRIAEAFKEISAARPTVAMAFVAPRGVGPTAWNPDPQKQIQNRRRFYLLGQTLEEMQTLDIRCAMRAVRAAPGLETSLLEVRSEGSLSGATMYAAIFEEVIGRMVLHHLSPTHRDHTPLLNVNRVLDIPQAAAMAAEQTSVVIHDDHPERWRYPSDVTKALDWPADRFVIEPVARQ